MSGSNERAVSRERNLRNASAELVKASGREQIYAAVLKAVLPFIEEAPGTRVSVWSGSAEQDHCVGAAGHRAEDIRGKVTYIKDFPDWLRIPLLRGKTAEIKPGKPAEFKAAFGFETKVGAIFMVPLMVRDRFSGRIAIASDSELRGDIRYVLEVLASQAVLALERTFLDEEVFRRRSDERFRKLIQNSSDITTMLEVDGTIQYESPSVERILGYKPEELVGKNVLDYVHPQDIEELLGTIPRVLENPATPVTIEFRFRHADGSWRYLESVSANLLDDPFTGGVVINSRDVTERKQTEVELRQSEERFKTLFEHSVDALIVHDEYGRIFDCNSEACRTLGYTREELLSLRIKDIATGLLSEEECREQEQRGGTLWQRVVRGDPDTFGTVHYGEHKRKDGTTFPIEVHVGAVDYGGRRLILGSVRDITERREFEKRLQENEQRYRSLFEYNTDAVYELDLAGRFVSTNPAMKEISGYGNEDLVDTISGDYVVPEHREMAIQQFVLARKGEPRTYETAITNKEGHRVELAMSYLPIYVGDQIVGVYGIAKDITERKRAEEELRESETRFRTLFDQTAIGVCVADLDRRLVETNEAYQQITGYSGEELMGMTTLELTHPDDRAGDTGVNRTFVSDKFDSYQREKRYIRKDGEVVWAKATSTLVRDAQGEPQFIMGVVEDVTDRRRADEELREAEERFRSAFENTAVGMALVDHEGRYLQVNQAMRQILGYSEEEFLSTTYQEITYPEDHERSMSYAQRIREGETDSYSLEKRYVHAEGHQVWVNLSVSLVRGSEDEASYYIAQVQDIAERKRAEEALHESEQRYRSLVELSPDAIVVHSEGNIVYVNSAGVELFGASEPGELIGRKALDFVHPDYREIVQARVKRALTEGYSSPLLDEKYVRLDGNIIDVEVAGTPVHYLGKPAMQVVFRNVSERKRAEEAIRQSEERYRAVVERTADGIYIYDFHTKRILETNTALQDMLGYSSEEFLGRPIYDLIAHSREDIARNGRRIAQEKSAFLGERRYRRKDGSLLDVETSATMIPHEGKEAVCAIVRDITERKVLEEELSYQAFHDSLTGLPNRMLLTERLEHALARAGRDESRVAVLFMDLDNFKDVNDSLGHDAGDQLLISVANLLREVVRPGDTVARFGGDELSILLEDVADMREATYVVRRIEEALQEPITVEGHEMFVSASIGSALSRSAQDSPERLLSHADVAMYRAKNSGKSRHEVFAPGMEIAASNRLQLGNDLRRAVEQNEFRVCYQPKVRLSANLQRPESSASPEIMPTPESMNGHSIVGMEALVRWEHPEFGTIGPEEFISTAEETGLIIPIGHRVLEEACRQTVAWRKQRPTIPPLIMCVNLSARQFQQPGLAQDIARTLQETGLEPQYLELEITESVVMEEVGDTLNILRELRNLGVGLAIDDFGTGHSSLSYLKRFPMGFLKIDRSFVEGIEEDEENQAITSGIITLAHTLDLEVVAEGVETAGQAARLRHLGCDMAQGNYFSEPLPGEAAGELLARRTGMCP